MNSINKKKKIVIGLPSLNEEDSISNVVSVVDKGLTKYFSNDVSVIVNADSSSEDNTVSKFNSTKTVASKLSINTGRNGKGSNVLAILKYSSDIKADATILIDSDLLSIKPIWIYKMANPILNDSADYVTPMYRRNRYEGNTTNHLCFPIISSLWGIPLRQPIAGDFSLSSSMVQSVLKREINVTTNQYGIDIFLTTNAIINKHKIVEISLGEKVHKPSYGKMIPMFKQVATSLFLQVGNFKRVEDYKNIFSSSAINSSISNRSDKPDSEKILASRNMALSLISDYDNKIKFADYYDDKFASKEFKEVDTDVWSNVLAKIVNYINENGVDASEANRIAEYLLPIYLLRVDSYFRDIEKMSPKRIEKYLLEQANTLKSKLII